MLKKQLLIVLAITMFASISVAGMTASFNKMFPDILRTHVAENNDKYDLFEAGVDVSGNGIILTATMTWMDEYELDQKFSYLLDCLNSLHRNAEVGAYTKISVQFSGVQMYSIVYDASKELKTTFNDYTKLELNYISF